MKHILNALFIFIFCPLALADQQVDSIMTAIAKAADVQTLTDDKDNEIKLTAGDVKSMSFELAKILEYVETEDDFSWVGSSEDAWEIDSGNWGETTFEDGLSYIQNAQQESSNFYELEESEYKKLTAEAAIEFKKLKTMNVKFGVAPFGAVQCGVQFPSLMVFDLDTGLVYAIAMEGSGC